VPYIKADKTPEEVLEEVFGILYSDDKEYLSMCDYLLAFKIGKCVSWDEYRSKIPDNILTKWGKVQKECYRQGYILDKIIDGKIYWSMIVMPGGTPSDICTLCERECRRREKINSGEARILLERYGIHEEKRCWDKGE